jgi:hypothetical protein
MPKTATVCSRKNGASTNHRQPDRETLKQYCFGQVAEKKMILSELGNMVDTEWLKTFDIRKDMNFTMGEYVVMPNHFHAILEIVVPVGATLVVGPNRMVIHPTTDNTTILQSNNAGEPERQIGQP